MLELTLFALSAGIALVTTNLDNLAVLLGLFLVVDRHRAIIGFALAQTIMLSLSMIVAVGLNNNGIPFWIGYLGLVPLVLGLRGIWQQASSTEVEEMGAKSAVTSIVTLFLSLSIDSFAVMTPLLADSTPSFRWAALIGASIAAAALVLLASWRAPHAQNLAPRFARMDRIAPYVMVCVGLYILINSPTDGL